MAAGRATTSPYSQLSFVCGGAQALADEMRASADVVWSVAHGAWGEGGQLHATLEAAGVQFVGTPPDKAANATDKLRWHSLHAGGLQRCGTASEAPIVLKSSAHYCPSDHCESNFDTAAGLRTSCKTWGTLWFLAPLFQRLTWRLTMPSRHCVLECSPGSRCAAQGLHDGGIEACPLLAFDMVLMCSHLLIRQPSFRCFGFELQLPSMQEQELDSLLDRFYVKPARGSGSEAVCLAQGLDGVIEAAQHIFNEVAGSTNRAQMH
jgi:hypothetical protein